MGRVVYEIKQSGSGQRSQSAILQVKISFLLEGKTTPLEKIPQFTVTQTDNVVLYFTLQEGY